MKYSLFNICFLGKAAVLSVVAAFMLLFASCVRHEESAQQLNVYESLREVNRLELARMTVGKVGMISDKGWNDSKTLEGKVEALVNKVKVGTRIGVYSYDTYVTAYVDLSKLQPEDITVDREAGTLDVVLPAVEIMVDGRQPQLHEDHYRVTGMRSTITPKERADLKAQMAQEVSKEISAAQRNTEALRKSAEQKARTWIAAIAQDWGLASRVEFR